uniref:vitamin-K-epoxide reductase (warfarin-sensitive) n=1 Tax=Setaria digitata TaxID=48799 RepID=A0A915Q1I2_9BILA
MGLAISLYALYVEHNLDSKIDYRPMCDLAQYISCSKAFRSPFAKGLGVTSPLLGADHILTQVS